MEKKVFLVSLDTGADVSVTTASQWPSRWPKRETVTQLQGIGQTQNSEQSMINFPGEKERVMKGLFSHTLFLT